MRTLSILIVIDSIGALATGSLIDNVYLIDTNKYLGSWKEGTDTLHTVCQDGQLITWRVISVSPNNNVDIFEFSGKLVSEKICIPSKLGNADDSFWESRIETQGRFASYSYTITVIIGGRSMSFSPYIKVV